MITYLKIMQTDEIPQSYVTLETDPLPNLWTANESLNILIHIVQ